MERQLLVLALYGPGRSTTAPSGMRYKQHQVSLVCMRSNKGQLRKGLFTSFPPRDTPRLAICSSAGQFEERIFVGLDFVVAEAAKRGLKLILALTNYWTPFGGMPQYVRLVLARRLFVADL